MNTMEFEEMKKIWDTQNQKTMYAIDEDALQHRIQSRKRYASHCANYTEIFLIVVNIAAGGFVLSAELMSDRVNVYMYLLSIFMLITAVFVLLWHFQRRKRENRFDNSMVGNLNHAIQNAGYQVRLSQIMRWYILPIGLFFLLGLWQSDKPIWILIPFALLMILTVWGSRWEHQIYIRRKRQLEKLRMTLTSDEAAYDG